MGHYAKVSNGIVEDVIVAKADFIATYTYTTPVKWVKTSYNTRGGVHHDPNTGSPDDGTPIRKNYAGIGDTYDAVRDAFYQPQPYPSWNLNETSCLWEPPIAMPDDGQGYVWNETTTSWDVYSG
mgnify:CR=1 FL=1|tara:strand:+ start:120 stop:491 length:372 start_codon:yes stop_codon:yes gene_type:complete